MALSTRYSHAVPFLRARLVLAFHEAARAATITEERAAHNRAIGLRDALDIITSSDDQTVPDGIGDYSKLPEGSVDAAALQLGRAAEALLGPRDTWAAE